MDANTAWELPAVPLHTGSHSLATRVEGNVEKLRGIERWLQSLAGAAMALHDSTTTQATNLRSAWHGDAADACQENLVYQQGQARGLAKAATEVAAATGAFASEISGVKADMATARAAARSAGYPVTADAIHLPMPLANPSQTVVNGINITDTVTKARKRESLAHKSLSHVLTKYTTFLDFFRKSMATRSVAAARGSFTSTMGTQWYQDSAAARARGLAAATTLFDNSDGALRGAAYQQMVGRVPGVLTDTAAANANSLLTARPFHHTNKVPDAFLKSFHYSGGVLAGAGIATSIATGTPADRAVGVGVSSWAGGALASGGVAAGLTALGVGAGPVGWVALGVGIAASAGVGYVVDHQWDDITTGVKNLFH